MSVSVPVDKLVSGLGQYLQAMPEIFLALLLSPGRYFQTIFDDDRIDDKILMRNAIIFCILSVLIGTAVGAYLELSGAPTIFEIGAVITILVIWFIIPIVLHPFIKLVGGRGNIEKTISVFLFVVAFLHIIWIPSFALLAKLVTETKVTLTYSYAVSFSLGQPDYDGRSEWADPVVIKEHYEIYIKDKDPEKEGTVLPPVDIPKDAEAAADVIELHAKTGHQSPRISTSKSPYPPPERTEEKQVNPDYWDVARLVTLLYITSHFFYLSKGISAAHSKSWVYWFSMAYIAPVVLLMIIIITVLMLGTLF